MAQIEAGRYEQKQLSSPSKLIAWSHGSRFDVARALLESRRGGRLLDYGAGDGTLLKLVSDAFPNAVGADPSTSQVVDCRERFGAHQSLEFYTIDELRERYDGGSFDVVTCMEVLEHCVTADVERVLDDLAHFVGSKGRVIISVPIEIGPSLAIKQVARRLAGMRGLGDYAYMEGYSPGEMLRMLFATASTRITRPVTAGPEGGAGHGHKGFNWRALEKRIETRFSIERRLFSPLGLFEGFFSSQVWFVCQPRSGA